MRKNTILFVEEDEHLRLAAKIFLESVGFSVVTSLVLPKDVSKYDLVIKDMKKPYQALDLLNIIGKRS